MEFIIRQEEKRDYESVEEVVRLAFAGASHTDGTEHILVQKLRGSEAFVSALSLVAESHHRIVGHILFSIIDIESDVGAKFKSLALAPVSVHPDFQGQGVGGALIERGHQIALAHGFDSVVLLGHHDYYARFGYEPASKWKIRAPFEVPDENFMAIALKESALAGVSGVVRYAPEFGVE